MFAEATSGRMTPSQYLKQDFVKVDSTSMHDLAVLFYQANDYISAGTCWEIALGKVKKHGKAYEQMINSIGLDTLQEGFRLSANGIVRWKGYYDVNPTSLV